MLENVFRYDFKRPYYVDRVVRLFVTIMSRAVFFRRIFDRRRYLIRLPDGVVSFSPEL